MRHGVRTLAVTFGLSLFTLIALPSFAQNPTPAGPSTGSPPAGGPPIEAIIYVQDLTPGDLGNRIRDILVTRIAGKFAAFNLHEISAPILTDGTKAGETDIRVQPLLAQQIPAATDLVVAAIFRIKQTAVDIQFILLDPKQKTVLGGVLSRARTGLTVFTSVDAAVNDLDPVLTRYLTDRYEYRPPQGVVESITLKSSLEGEEVFFAGRNVGKVSGGVLAVPYTPFPIGSKVRVEIRKRGYHPEETVIDLPGATVETSIPALRRASHFSAAANWVFGQALGYGIAARIYGIPDWSFLELSAYRDLAPKVRSNFHDQRHYDFGASIGQYVLLSYRSMVRVAIRLGAGIIYTSLADVTTPDFTEFYLNLLSPTVEVRVFDWQLYLQPQLKFTIGAGDNLLGRSWITTSLGLPPISIGVMRSW